MKPFYLISVILIACLTPHLLAQDCNNPLLNFFGIQGLELPESGEGLKHCESLKTSRTCCSAETVDALEDRLQNLVKKLNNYNAARDYFLAQLNDKFFDRFRDILKDINEFYVKQSNIPRGDEVQRDLVNFNQIRDQAQEIHDQFEGALKEYQDARKKCFDTALMIQASAWCLACNPNYANLGVNEDGSVTFSEEDCRYISDACSPYFDQGARFNPLIRMREAFWRLSAVAKYLHEFSQNNAPARIIVPKDPWVVVSTQAVVIVPEKWDGQDSMCHDLWSKDVLLSELLTIGNSPTLTLGEEEGAFIEEGQAGAVDDWQERFLFGLVQLFSGYDWDPNGLEPGFGLEPDPSNYYYYYPYDYYYQDISDWF